MKNTRSSSNTGPRLHTFAPNYLPQQQKNIKNAAKPYTDSRHYYFFCCKACLQLRTVSTLYRGYSPYRQK